MFTFAAAVSAVAEAARRRAASQQCGWAVARRAAFGAGTQKILVGRAAWQCGRCCGSGAADRQILITAAHAGIAWRRCGLRLIMRRNYLHCSPLPIRPWPRQCPHRCDCRSLPLCAAGSCGSSIAIAIAHAGSGADRKARRSFSARPQPRPPAALSRGELRRFQLRWPAEYRRANALRPAGGADRLTGAEAGSASSRAGSAAAGAAGGGADRLIQSLERIDRGGMSVPRELARGGAGLHHARWDWWPWQCGCRGATAKRIAVHRRFGKIGRRRVVQAPLLLGHRHGEPAASADGRQQQNSNRPAFHGQHPCCEMTAEAPRDSRRYGVRPYRHGFRDRLVTKKRPMAKSILGGWEDVGELRRGASEISSSLVSRRSSWPTASVATVSR